MEERLQKFLAHCGVASRRKCEELIKKGLVSVNGVVITDMGVKIDGEEDEVKYQGKVVKPEGKKIFIMLNKPCGVISTVREQFNRPKVTDFVGDAGCRLYPVGRLDYDSSGLILLTNDGDITYKLTHPGCEVDKTYIAKVFGIPDTSDIEKLRRGIDIGGFITSPAKVVIKGKMDDACILEITIHEGKNRQVRRMCSAVGHDVLNLKRLSIGEIRLGDLKEGAWRYLTGSEVDYLVSL